jgi:hypothetical protein
MKMGRRPSGDCRIGHVSVQICSLLAPCRRPILIATKYLVLRGQDTSLVTREPASIPQGCNPVDGCHPIAGRAFLAAPKIQPHPIFYPQSSDTQRLPKNNLTPLLRGRKKSQVLLILPATASVRYSDCNRERLLTYSLNPLRYEKPNRLFCAWNRSRVRNRELHNLFEGEREATSLYFGRGRIRHDGNCGSEDH